MIGAWPRPIQVGDRAIVIVPLQFLRPDEPCKVVERLDDGVHDCWMISPERDPHLRLVLHGSFWIDLDRCRECPCYKAGEDHCDACQLRPTSGACPHRPSPCSQFGCGKADEILGNTRGR
jgi:hypothetical protein